MVIENITIRANKKEGTISQEVNDLMIRDYKSLNKEERKMVNDALTKINPKREYGVVNHKEETADHEGSEGALEAWAKHRDEA